MRLLTPRKPRRWWFYIKRAGFVASTGSPVTQVVYLRSDALHKMCKAKHTLRLQSTNHESSENIFAVLEERYGSTQRFALVGRQNGHAVKSHENIKRIDLYFTNNIVSMPGAYAPVEVPGTTDAQIAEWHSQSKIHLFLDHDVAGYVRKADNTNAVVGDDVRYLQTFFPDGAAAAVFQPNTGVPNIVVAELNDKTKGIAMHAGGAWEAAVATGPAGQSAIAETVALLSRI